LDNNLHVVVLLEEEHLFPSLQLQGLFPRKLSMPCLL
jgi:hypothetical protein